MSLSKKYYIEFANIFNQRFKNATTTEEKIRINKLVDDFCLFFYRDNQRFNEDRFKSACGCEQDAF